MKKFNIKYFVLVSASAVFLFITSCNSAFEEYWGTVVVSLGAPSREIGHDGLPILNTARIRVEGIGSKSGAFSKDFSSPSFSMSFPIGDELTFRVSILTPSARWTSEDKQLTVQAGTNAVSVKLGKQVSALENLLFTVNTASQQEVKSFFKIGSTQIGEELSSIGVPSLCRDNKGRVYRAYKQAEATGTHSHLKIERYSSEGNKEDTLFSFQQPGSTIKIASDFVNGTAYISIDRKLYKETGREFKLVTVQGQTLPLLHKDLFAVSGNTLAFTKWGNLKELYLYSISEDTSNGVTAELLTHKEIWRDIDFDFDQEQGASITDIFIKDDYIYLIFETHAIDHAVKDKYYTVGGLVRYKIEKISDRWELSAAESIGFNKTPDFENKLIKDTYYKDHFCGPVKFIGFDETSLYIADDGVSFQTTDSNPVIKANHDRIAKYGFFDQKLSFQKAPEGITWMLNKEIQKNANVSINIENTWDD